ncbi:MAG TPA: precorrin-8X methylmutase [Polyangiaceae bacterium]|nr:precorrin-8X methylmutase [Polyangiaceae bacterium]
MSDTLQTTSGRELESGGFAIIDQEAGSHHFPPDEWQIVRRVIHATADFEFLDLMCFSPGATRAGVEALEAGCPIVVDMSMISSGPNSERLTERGCTVHSFISDDDVIASARAHNSTRAIEAMRKAHALGVLDGAIAAVGNAPTALLALRDLVRDHGARPALVIGVPVGFVSAAESKEATLGLDVPHIVARGRKGGSVVAVAILQALLAQASAPAL